MQNRFRKKRFKGMTIEGGGGSRERSGGGAELSGLEGAASDTRRRRCHPRRVAFITASQIG